MTGKSSIFEKMVVRSFFFRKNRLQCARLYGEELHKKLYAEQAIELNEGAAGVDRPYTDTSKSSDFIVISDTNT